MQGLREQLQQCFQGRVCLMGLGNVDYGDDGFGVYLAEKLVRAAVPDVIVAGTMPERWVGRVADRGFQHLVFVDVVDFGGKPGSVVFLTAGEIATRFPQISTHKISLGVLAKLAESNGKTQAWLLGVQPESLGRAQPLTPTIQASLEVLHGLIFDAWSTASQRLAEVNA